MRKVAAATAAAAGLLAVAAPAHAHGISSRADLPLPLWLVAYSGAGVLIISFGALAWLWPQPRLQALVPSKALPRRFTVAMGIARPVASSVGVLAFLVVWAAALFGNPDPGRNFAARAVFVVFWVGLFFASGLIGDLWAGVSPFRTISSGREISPMLDRVGQWPAAILLFAFTWFELAYPTPASPRVLGTAISVYFAITVAGLAAFGRPWLAAGEAFGALFTTLAHMAPLERSVSGWRLRWPLTGLPALHIHRGTTAIILIALGSTTFDGVERTQVWGRFLGSSSGWATVLLNTFGLILTVVAVGAVYYAAVALVGPLSRGGLKDVSAREIADQFAHTLVPIALGYAIAHYFSLVVFEGQRFIAQVSDPFGRGSDIFGTAAWTVNFSLVSPSLIAWVQVGAIVGGHVAGVLLAHDRAVALVPGGRATATQYPLLAAMIVYTVGGLLLLLGG